jgi:hypothetical protein
MKAFLARQFPSLARQGLAGLIFLALTVMLTVACFIGATGIMPLCADC